MCYCYRLIISYISSLLFLSFWSAIIRGYEWMWFGFLFCHLRSQFSSHCTWAQLLLHLDLVKSRYYNATVQPSTATGTVSLLNVVTYGWLYGWMIILLLYQFRVHHHILCPMWFNFNCFFCTVTFLSQHLISV